MSSAYIQQRRPIHLGLRPPPFIKKYFKFLLLCLMCFFPDVREMLPPLYLYNPPHDLISHLRDDGVSGRS